MTHTTKHTPGLTCTCGVITTVIETGIGCYDANEIAQCPLCKAAPAMYADAKQLCELVRDFMNDNRLYDGQVIQAISNLETALSQAEGRDK